MTDGDVRIAPSFACSLILSPPETQCIRKNAYCYPTDPREDGVVLSQEPTGSFRAERGAVVMVTVGRLG